MCFFIISKMVIDKFGRSGESERSTPGPPGIGFFLTSDGNYDMQFKRLVNINNPTHVKDAATKEYIDDEIDVINKTITLLRKSIDDTYDNLMTYINAENLKITEILQNLELAIINLEVHNLKKGDLQ